MSKRKGVGEMNKKMLIAIGILVLAGCSGNGNQPTPPNPSQPSPTIPAPSPIGSSSSAVFVGADKYGIYTLDANGQNKKTLHLGGSPSWTPDGKQIVFNYGDQVWRMNEDGSGATQVGNVPVAFLSGVQQGGNLITFIGIDRMPGNQENMDVWIMGADGTNPRKLVVGAATQPSISSDGSWICYTQQAGGHREIWRINTDGSNKKQLTFTSDEFGPDANACSISPDGKWIGIFLGVEASDTDPNPGNWGLRNVAIISADGGSRRVVTKCLPIKTNPDPQNSCITADSPGWSPDGTKLVYDRGSPNPNQSGFWMIDVGGSNDHLISLTPHGAGKSPMR